MAKISGSYSSIARGVSQQVPEQRLDGQHGEQVNMVSDPVVGLTRRRGTRWVTDHLASLQYVGAEGPDREYVRSTRTFDFTSELYGDYTLLFQTVPRPLGGAFFAPARPSLFFKGTDVYPKDFAVINVDPSIAATIDAYLDKGIKAVTKVGELFVLALANNKTTGTGEQLAWAAAANLNYGTYWIRGGAYSRRYTATVNVNGTNYTATYTTPSASYPGTLDTSDIPFSSPEYTKLVNDRVNAYNAAVTTWIGTAGAAVQPPAIAIQLAVAIQAACPVGTIVLANGPDIFVQNNGLMGMGGSDGGDGTLLITTHTTVTDAGKAPARMVPGKILKVQPNDSAPAYFLKARGLANSTDFGQVVWEETAGSFNTPQAVFLYGALQTPTQFMITASPGRLAALTPAKGWAFPEMNGRIAGDGETSPAPNFLGRQIDYLGTFQDRLVVASGGVLNFSEVGNYLNFYRTSALTVKDSDPIEIFAIGAETDVIRHSTIFDKSLVLFGDKQQYTIDGRIPVTPSTTTVIQSSAHEDATDAAPVTNGELVFFAKRRENLARLYQIEVGDVQDTSRASAVDQQLSDYIKGRPIQILATTSPNLVLMRTTGNYRNLYVFRYLDAGRERLLDSWSRWEYPEECGELMGMSRYEDQVILFFWREADGANGVGGFISVDSQSLLTQLDDYPHLDSMRPYLDLRDGDRNRPWYNQPFISAVVLARGSAWLQGETPATVGQPGDPGFMVGYNKLVADYPGGIPSQLIAGVQFTSYVDLTSPYRRDQNGVAITTGRLVVSRLDLSYRDTAGMLVQINSPLGTAKSLDFSGRILGSASAIYAIPVGTGSVPAFVGRESRGYTARVCSKDWKPLTLTAIEYTGQYFFNSRRA